jgi:hypothetical protein
MAEIKGSTVYQPLADTMEPGYNERNAPLSPYRYEVRYTGMNMESAPNR